MPGAKTAKNLLKRNVKLAVRIKSIKFSPDGTQFAAATTEGLIIYSNRPALESYFNPYLIDESVTIDNIISKVKAEEYLTALVLSLRLDDPNVLQTVYKCVPSDSIPLIISNMPEVLLVRLLNFLAHQIETS